MTKDTNIVILAGGISSRMKTAPAENPDVAPHLRDDAQRKSKAMIGVGTSARPFMDYILYNAQVAGYREAVIVVGEHDPSIRHYYESQNGAQQFKNLSISYAIQRIPEGRTKPLGTADALLEALVSKPGWRNQSFTVCNSDNLYSVNVLRILLEVAYANAMIDYDRATLNFTEERIAAFAVIKKDENGYLLDIIEKPGAQEIGCAQDRNGRIGVSMNIFKLAYDKILPILRSIPLHPIRHEKELPLAVRTLIKEHPRSLMTIPCSEHVIDLTSQSDIPTVQQYLKTHFPDFSSGSL